MFQSRPIHQSVLSLLLGAFMFSQWNLEHSFSSIFLQFSAFCLHHSLVLPFPFSAVVNHISHFPVSLMSFCPSQPLSTLLLFTLFWILNLSLSLYFLLHHLSSLTLLPFSFYVRALILSPVLTRGILLILGNPPPPLQNKKKNIDVLATAGIRWALYLSWACKWAHWAK